jgi:hypothetical protein
MKINYRTAPTVRTSTTFTKAELVIAQVYINKFLPNPPDLKTFLVASMQNLMQGGTKDLLIDHWSNSLLNKVA